MATNRQQTSKVVLHVRPIRAFAHHHETTGEQIDTQLQQVNYRVEMCTDVYRALARLSRASQFDQDTVSSYQAVVVCVDNLGQNVFEFFTIIAEHAHHTPVLVYSNADNHDLLAKAKTAGATGIFDDNFATVLADYHVVDPDSSLSPSTESVHETQEPTPPQPFESAIAHDSPVSPILTLHQEVSELDASEPDAPELDASDAVDEDASPVEAPEEQLAGPIQVPWQTRQEGPVRMPPSHSSDDATVTSPEAAPPTQDDAHAPLLTEDELKALLDEDVASWPPNDWGQPDAANPNSGAELS